MQPVDFVGAMIERQVLQFGDFTLKSGARSPYFFNLGLVSDGAGIALLGDAYAARLESMTPFDVVFGPAYKGIPLAVAASIALARDHGRNVGVAYNRKEEKDHGEGGALVGEPLAGKDVVLVDDVLTAGTAIREAVALVGQAGGRIAGVLVALDRQEALHTGKTALETLASELDVPCVALSALDDVIRYLDLRQSSDKDHKQALERIRQYRDSA